MNTTFDTFNLLFGDKVALERRATNLENSIQFYDSTIERLENGVVRPWTTRRLNKAIERRADAVEELDFIKDELVYYQDVPELPRDKFSFDYEITTNKRGKEIGMVTLTVTDSYFDDTFELGDKLTVRTSGTKKTKKGERRFASTMGKLVASSEEDGVATYVFGSSLIGNSLKNYDETVFSIRDNNGDAIFSESAKIV